MAILLASKIILAGIVTTMPASPEVNSLRIADLSIRSIESQLFAENAYIVHREGQNDCVIVDPGFQYEELASFLDSEALRPLAILNTHGHSDHIAGNDALKQRWPDAPIVIGHEDAYKLTDPNANLSAPFGASLISPAADVLLREGESVQYAELDFEILETPGHSKGHIVFVYRGSPNVIFGGDVLFQRGIGRSDFFDGDFQALVDSIQKKLFQFPLDTVVYPGHGPSTTIGEEIENNPFVGKPAGFELAK